MNRTLVIPGLHSGFITANNSGAASDQAVCVATLQSLWRFMLEKGDGGKEWWQADRRYRLPRLGVYFAGPWIAGGHLYYTSGGSLFHITLKDLLSKADPLPASRITSLPSSAPSTAPAVRASE